MTTPIQEVAYLGQAMWLDYIRRGMLSSGELMDFVDLGISGVTSNPTIFEKAIVGSTDYDDALLGLAQTRSSTMHVYETLAIEDIRGVADVLRPLHERSCGAHGYVSLEVSPLLAYDTENTVVEARRLFAALDRPNVMVKVPATTEGVSAIRRLVAEGVNVNVTLVFSRIMYREVMEAYIAGLEDLAHSGGDLPRVASVASFFLSRVDTAIDAILEEHLRTGRTHLADVPGKAAVANAKLAYRDFMDAFGTERFAVLSAKGARVQRPLWASTGTKNPAYNDLVYVQPLIGPDTINTMPPATVHAFLDHGVAEATLERSITHAGVTLARLEADAIDFEAVASRLLADGVKAFADSFDKLLAGIDDKLARLRAPAHVYPGTALGEHLPEVEAVLANVDYNGITRRMWRKDHTVWKPEPTGITNRLGWLTVTDLMHEQTPAIETFAADVRDAGFESVVLLGMGGSSLAPQVLRHTFGSADSRPELTVLDSTLPRAVAAVAQGIEVQRTLFVVSSKSGSTIEPNVLYRYFRALTDAAVGTERSGQHFVAITDPGSPLAALAEAEAFRRTFLNPPDIGGRYSALSFFGLVPAALIGVDLSMLLDRADCMREACASCVPAQDDPAAWLGAVMGVMALNGRDKLTLVTSPTLSTFALWVEQLIAESTGKDGTGIIPVVGEPLLDPQRYGHDRYFVYLHLARDDNSPTDAAVETLTLAGHPVFTIDIDDTYDLGAEFFRWEFAAAMAGAILNIHPFDQPNVQAAKDATQVMLDSYVKSGQLPHVDTPLSLSQLLGRAQQGTYVSIMAYLPQTEELNEVLTAFRLKVAEEYGITTTLGYGPRYLHSTGQLHKGGPDSGRFLQIVAHHEHDVPIPGEPYTFGVVADAQALGDLEALRSLGRPVARLHLSGDGGEAVKELSRSLSKVVSA